MQTQHVEILCNELIEIQCEAMRDMHTVMHCDSMQCKVMQGNARQWKLQIVAGILLSALILPVFVSVHSIVSWDFGMAVSVKAWHSTVFAPYFVVGAVHSGVSAVIFVLILLRQAYGWHDYIRREHVEALCRLLIVVSTGWFYYFVMEIIFGIYGREADEVAIRTLQFTIYPWNLSLIHI